MRQRGSNAPLRHLQTSNPMSPTNKKRFYTRGVAYTEMYGGQMGGVNPNEMGGNQPPMHPSPTQQSLLYGQQMGGMAGGSIFPNNSGGNGEMQGLDASYQPFGRPPIGMDGQMMGGFDQQPMFENNSIRHKPLDPTYIDSYLQKNRHRIFSCRKCKLNFPHREYLQRHLAYHNDLDNRPFGCDQCPQRFGTEKQLNSHMQKHAEDSPHRCVQCNGAFRSALALRRHQDQSRQCYRPPFGVYQPQSLIVSPNAPLDEFAFIDDPPTVFGMNRQKTIDSGVASDSSTHSYNTSPVSNCNEDEVEIGMQHPFAPSMGPKKLASDKPKDEETDSGVEFRSRLNSTAQSCSPGSSSFSSDAGSSPARKYSKTSVHNPHEQQIHGHIQAGSVAEYLTTYNTQPSGYKQPAYHPHNTRSSEAAGRSSNGYYGGVSGGWTAGGISTSIISPDYSLGGQFRGSEGGLFGLQMATIGTNDHLLKGKLAFPTFDLATSESESELLAELESFDPFGFRPVDDQEAAADGQEVVEEAIRMFLKRFIAVFLDAAISIKAAAGET